MVTLMEDVDWKARSHLQGASHYSLLGLFA